MSNLYQYLRFVCENVSDKSDKILSDIVEFNHKLNGMEYILPINGKIIRKIKEKDYDNYKTLNHKEFVKYNGGTCFDYAMYEAFYFEKNFKDVEFDTFYCDFTDVDGDHPSHSFLLFFINGKTYWFESSWKQVRGIYEFDSINMALSYIVEKLKSGAHSKIVEEYIYKYDALNPDLIGVGWTEYRKIIMKNKVFPYRKIKNAKCNNFIKKDDDIDKYKS